MIGPGFNAIPSEAGDGQQQQHGQQGAFGGGEHHGQQGAHSFPIPGSSGIKVDWAEPLIDGE